MLELDQAEIAAEAGTSQATISRAERDTATITTALLARVEAALATLERKARNH